VTLTLLSNGGVYKCRQLGEKGYIVINESNPTIEPFMQKLSQLTEYKDVFVDRKQTINNNKEYFAL
jgi:hypothetical protein